jgi:pseudouridine synthase
MEITSFLQSKWYSRRTIITLLQGWLISKNNEKISYRKEAVETWDLIVIHEIEPVTLIVEWEITNYEIVLFNKPTWYTVSKHDEHNQIIFDILPEWWKKKYNYIGRLDKDSYWLLVLTNATKLVSFFSHPRYEHEKKYKIQTDQPMTPEAMQQGITWMVYHDEDTNEDIPLSRKSCKPLKNNQYEVIIMEWKKRHLRRLCDLLWYNVTGLCRIQFWPWSIGDIPQWKWEIIPISSSDVESLLENQNSYIPKQI